jgi:predicted nucleotidyltransferase
MTSTLPHLHTLFLERVRTAVEHDERVVALLGGGSLVHGGFDEQSDLDLVLVVEENAHSDLMGSRIAFAQGLGDLVAAFTGEHVGEPRLLICLYGPPLLHVDLKFVTASDLDHRIERPAVLFARDADAIASRLDGAAIAWPNMDPDWFEARAWIWLHYAATKLHRGELYEAIGMLGFFREQVLGPMLYRRKNLPQRGVRRIETLGLDQDGRLAATVAGHDALSVKGAILAAVYLYLDLREDTPPASNAPNMPSALLAFIG